MERDLAATGLLAGRHLEDAASRPDGAPTEAGWVQT
jgi:hypothetical protein